MYDFTEKSCYELWISLKLALGGIFGLAIDDAVIATNSAHNLGRLYGKRELKSTHSIKPLTRDDLSLLLNTFQEHFPLYYPFVLTLSRTGIRLGEAIDLQWEDINFQKRFIHVQRSLSKGKISTTKNGKGRHVDMCMQLTEVLWRLKRERKSKMGLDMKAWVFLNESGVPHNETHWRRDIFNNALEIAKIRRIRIHDLRHTYASLLLQAGESMVYIRDQLGHSSIKITVDIYGHLVPGSNKQAVDKLDDAPEITTIRNLSATNPINKDSLSHSKSFNNIW